MIELSDAAVALFRDHYGIASLAELNAAGVSAGTRRRLRQIGLIEPVIRGVYRARTSVESELALARCGCLANEGFVVAGPASGRMWRFRRLPKFDDAVDFVAPPASNAPHQSWLRLFRCSVMEDTDIVIRADGIRVLSPPASVIHLARVLDDDSLESIVEQVLREFCSRATLARTAERFASPRRPWAQRVMRILEQRGDLAPAESDAELVVFRELFAAGVPVVRRQHWLSLDTGASIRLDLVDERIKWGVEVDVHPEHETVAGVARDKRRDRGCHRLGWQVERVTASDIRDLRSLGVELAELHRLRAASVSGLADASNRRAA